MEDPIVFETKPAVIDAEPGTHWWCACGRSKNQPWCDSSHRGTGISPVKAEFDEAKRVSLCNCKQTGNPPYCDGSHASC